MTTYVSHGFGLDATEATLLRRCDAGLAAACLAAVEQGAPRLAATLLIEKQGVAADGGTAAFLNSLTLGCAIGADGSIAPTVPDARGFARSNLLRFAAATVEYPIGGGSRAARLRRVLDWLGGAHRSGWRVQLAPHLSPALDFSVGMVRARPEDLPPDPARDGTGVVLGVVDYGCDFAHPAFRTPDGRTRLLRLWDHNACGATAQGRYFDAAAIDAALAMEDPYAALPYRPEDNPAEVPQSMSAQVVHGTHVLSVAGGRGGTDAGPAGVAPGADLVFVHLRPGALARSLGTGNGGEVLRGITDIFALADELGRPAVVNVSLGTNAGPHDGTDVLERAFDTLLTGQGRALVVPAGNNHDACMHAARRLTPGGSLRWRWVLPGGGATHRLALYYEADREEPRIELRLIAPDGTRHAAAGGPVRIARGDHHLGTVTPHARPAHAAGRVLHHVLVDLRGTAEPAAPGMEATAGAVTWGIELALPPGAPEAVSVDAWIDRAAAEPLQSRFDPGDASTRCTLNSLSCGQLALCVGAYYPLPPGEPITTFSAAGPTRDGRQKPDVVAPGYQVMAAQAHGGRGGVPLRVAMSGTSAAAPHVAGIAALLLQSHPTLDAAALGAALAATTQLAPPTISPTGTPPGRHWSPRFGHGRVDGAAAAWSLPS